MPKKPNFELCAHNQPAMEAECLNTQNDEFRTILISDTDKYIMISPDDWGLILLYIDRLERRLRPNRKMRPITRELAKFRNTSKKLQENHGI